MTITSDGFKAAMGQLASGVAVVTMRAQEADHGFTATSVTSLSLDPPLVLICVVRSQGSHTLIEECGHFAVNLLSTSQKKLGARFASAKSEERFQSLKVTRAETGAPLLPESLAWVDCRLHSVLPGGDHTIFVGEVLAGEAPGAAPPLLYHNRQWGTFQAV